MLCVIDARMTLDALIIFFGGLVALVPFLGFPSSWDRVILLTAGIMLIVLGIAVRRARGRRGASSNLSERTQSPLDLPRP